MAAVLIKNLTLATVGIAWLARELSWRFYHDSLTRFKNKKKLHNNLTLIHVNQRVVLYTFTTYFVDNNKKQTIGDKMYLTLFEPKWRNTPR